MKLSATPASMCTSDGVTITVCGNWIAAEYQRRMNPSGQQYCDGHCGALVLPWWYMSWTKRFWYSGVSTDSTVGSCTASIAEYQLSKKPPGA